MLFFQLVDGILQRFSRLNVVVGAPKTFVGKVEHLFRQGLIGLESEAREASDQKILVVSPVSSTTGYHLFTPPTFAD